MTASPVDAQTDVKQAAKELESLLHSEIATLRDPTLLQKTVSQPKIERTVRYIRPMRPPPNDLTLKIKTLVGTHSQFRKHFDFEELARIDLGSWCVNRFWQLVFKEAESLKLEAKTERDLTRSLCSVSARETHVQSVQEAREIVRAYEFPPLAPILLSDKVRQLQMVLREHFDGTDGQKTRCIVFVERRWTAMMLATLFHEPDMEIKDLRPDVLVMHIAHPCCMLIY